MSRSYRKNCYFVDPDSANFKSIFNKRIRRSSRTKDIPSGNAYRKCNNSYDIHDFKFGDSWKSFKLRNMEYFSSEKDMQAYWKKHYRSK